jgi:hypothetical protein
MRGTGRWTLHCGGSNGVDFTTGELQSTAQYWNLVMPETRAVPRSAVPLDQRPLFSAGTASESTTVFLRTWIF